MYMKLKCKCGHEWNYTGEAKHYVTCPSCYNKVRIGSKKEYLILDEEEIEVLNYLKKTKPEYKDFSIKQIFHKELKKALNEKLRKLKAKIKK